MKKEHIHTSTQSMRLPCESRRELMAVASGQVGGLKSRLVSCNMTPKQGCVLTRRFHPFFPPKWLP